MSFSLNIEHDRPLEGERLARVVLEPHPVIGGRSELQVGQMHPATLCRLVDWSVDSAARVRDLVARRHRLAVGLLDVNIL